MSDISKTVDLPINCVVSGRTWKLFTFDYSTPDGTFSSYLHAISAEHAAEMLMDMKATATIKGEMVGVVR